MTLAYSLIIGLAVVVALLVMIVAGVLRSHAEILRRLDQLGVRIDEPDHEHGTLSISPKQAPLGQEVAPAFSGISPDGDPVSISPASGGDPTLLAFLSTSCSSCAAFWEYFDSSLIRIDGNRYRVVVVTLGSDEESPTRAGKLRSGGVDVVMSSEAWQAYEVPGAPYFVAVEPGSGAIVGQGSTTGVPSLTTFLSDSVGDQSWDRATRDKTDAERERLVDDELRRAGLEPGDPRLHHEPGEIDG